MSAGPLPVSSESPHASPALASLRSERLFGPSRPFARRAEVGPPDLKGGAEVSEHRLRNGMRVFVAERRADPVVAVLLFYKVGSRNEREQEAGVSHFLEHLMFKGTQRIGKGEVDRITTELGGQNNAFTGNDHTAYWFELASDRWEAALDIEADRMQGLLLDPDEFEAERAVVLEELSMGEDDPWRVLAKAVEAGVFPRHPYGRPIIGFEESLQHMGVEDVREYFARFYHPGNATFVICGDVSPAAALRAVRKRFGKMPAGPSYAEADSFRLPVSEPLGEQRLTMRWDDAGRRLCMAWPTVKVGTDEDYALDLLSSILTSGRTSRLQRRLVHDARLATSVSTSNDTRVDGGLFWLFAECAHGIDPSALEAAIDEEFARLASEKPSAAELKRAQAMILSSEAYESETVSDLAEDLGGYAVDADWRMALDGCERYRAVKAPALREVSARLLVPERRVVGWSLPRAEEGAKA